MSDEPINWYGTLEGPGSSWETTPSGREQQIQWAMKMVDLAGLDPAPGTTLRRCAEALLASAELRERDARTTEQARQQRQVRALHGRAVDPHL